MRVRNRRTGKWVELPDDDGMVQIGSTIFTPEEVSKLANMHMHIPAPKDTIEKINTPRITNSNELHRRRRKQK